MESYTSKSAVEVLCFLARLEFDFIFPEYVMWSVGSGGQGCDFLLVWVGIFFEQCGLEFWSPENCMRIFSRRCDFVFLLLLGWSFAFFAAWGWKETADSGKCGGGGNLCLPVKVEDNGKKVKQESTIQNVCNFHLFFHHWLNAKRSIHGKLTVKNQWIWLGLKTLSVDDQKCHPTCTLYTTISNVQKW